MTQIDTAASSPHTDTPPPVLCTSAPVADDGPELCLDAAEAKTNQPPTTPRQRAGVVLAPPPAVTNDLTVPAVLSLLWRRSSSFLISLFVHGILLMGLSLAYLWVTNTSQPFSIMIVPAEDEQLDPIQQEIDVQSPVVIEIGDIPGMEFDVPQQSHTPDAFDVPSPFAGVPTPTNPQPAPDPRGPPDVQDIMVSIAAPVGGGFEGRTADARAVLVAERGGTPESENAVEVALEWMAAHQRPDGSWRFDFSEGPCQGKCRHSGTIGTSTGATGLVLLPFLGAGYTHKEGKYQETVQKALYYLESRMLLTPHGGDLQEGTMYAQGIATLALCEAYAMTRDKQVREAAQKGVDFIVYAQHPKGGWRYYPGQPGDTTVFGWQLMALKSAYMAGLNVPSPVFELAKNYLDTVQSDGGAAYGYISPGNDKTPTSVGLLSRMYLGWHRNDERLRRGVKKLAKQGPSRNDVYFNYYTTQIMSHYGDPHWKKWNSKLRDQLVKTQAKVGHEKGSWYFHEKHALAGGRLYTTAVATMILEVYYRHMPLYDESATW